MPKPSILPTTNAGHTASLLPAQSLFDALATRATEIAVLDASWYLPAMQRNARVEFECGHIPGAKFFDIDEHSDCHSDLPHMLPDAHTFATVCSKLGISEHIDVVIYDGAGLFSAARVWWMFKAFGHHRVAVLDGGLPAWLQIGGELARGALAVEPISDRSPVTIQLNTHAVVDARAIEANLSAQDFVVIDARPEARFAGREPEPRAGLRCGHIPGSISVPFFECLDAQRERLLPSDQLKEVFLAKGVDLSRPIVASCGSGVTACVLALALDQLGVDCAVYDGSWAEWGQESCAGGAVRPVARD